MEIIVFATLMLCAVVLCAKVSIDFAKEPVKCDVAQDYNSPKIRLSYDIDISDFGGGRMTYDTLDQALKAVKRYEHIGARYIYPVIYCDAEWLHGCRQSYLVESIGDHLPWNGIDAVKLNLI